MPVQVSYPGVYIEEMPSAVHSIVGVGDSAAAFVDVFKRGPVNEPTRINSMADFERTFGGVWTASEASYGISQFFLNGGHTAWVVRVAPQPVTDDSQQSSDSDAKKSGKSDSDGEKPGTSDSGEEESGKSDSDGDPAEECVPAWATTPSFDVEAASPGVWGNALQVAAINTSVKQSSNGAAKKQNTDEDEDEEQEQSSDDSKTDEQSTTEPQPTFTLMVRRAGKRGGRDIVLESEVFHNLTLGAGPHHVADVLQHESSLVRIRGQVTTGAADYSNVKRHHVSQAVNKFDKPDAANDGNAVLWQTLAKGSDGFDAADPDSVLNVLKTVLPGNEDEASGIYALRTMAPNRFNLLCLPATALMGEDEEAGDEEVKDNEGADIRTQATKLCRDERAMFLIDVPVRRDGSKQLGPVDMENWYERANLGELAEDAAVYYPPVEIPDSGVRGRNRIVGSSGTIAGLIARTDTERGFWKAPAGTEATLRGAAPTVNVSDAENGPLNELGVNVLRTFPVYGDICWGARTTHGADVMENQWKYLPVRRTALHIENSLHEGLKWVVFEPNDEPLWAQIRLDVGTFMHDLFRQGAFEGATPDEAYFVRCDHSTTTQSDIDKGIVNIAVGFAPLKPAEFVVVQISQIANG